MPSSSQSPLAVDRLVVGLGNPGPEYEWTRHNVGFHVLDRLASDARESESSGAELLFRSASRLPGYSGKRNFHWLHLERERALLVKPSTFMNLSGEALSPLVRFLAVGETPFDLTQLMVVYDDMDLDLGRLRIRPHGGAGGQNGMRSILECLGTDVFPRLRVGIGRPGTDAARHVLQAFTQDQRVEAEISVAQAAEAILDWLRDGDLSECMTRFHSRWNQD
ncbi:MAG: PTH1 family peptidyl-tRNA hydrolase [Planctomycetota bacterium]|jgi:PTH1 family peptidyl-tRNA hydrolase